MQGLLRMTKEQFKAPVKVARLWTHECERVFRDRLVSEADMAKYDDMQTAALKTWLKEEPLAEVQAAPNLFTSFMDQTADGTPVYSQARARCLCRALCVNLSFTCVWCRQRVRLSRVSGLIYDNWCMPDLIVRTCAASHAWQLDGAFFAGHWSSSLAAVRRDQGPCVSDYSMELAHVASLTFAVA